jgi:hypothetical protein
MRKEMDSQQRLSRPVDNITHPTGRLELCWKARRAGGRVEGSSIMESCSDEVSTAKPTEDIYKALDRITTYHPHPNITFTLSTSNTTSFTKHPQIILTLLAAALFAGVQAGCYNSGESWGNTGPANDAVQAICNSNNIAGSFSSGQTKSSCRKQGSNVQYNFEIKYNGGGSQTLSDTDCRYRLKNEVNGCGKGGQSTVGDWFYRYAA